MATIAEVRIACDETTGEVRAVEVHGQRGGVRAQFVVPGHELYDPVVALLTQEVYSHIQALDPVNPPQEEI